MKTLAFRLAAAWLALHVLLGTGCECREPSAAASPPGTGTSIVLYTSMDEELATPLLERFEKETGIRVLMVGDTEATKTTGLVQRLIAEKDRPRCDVWWSSEVLGTIRLEREGVLTEPGIGIAQRPRLIAFSTSRLGGPGQPPRPASILDLTAPSHKGRVGMARPQFGTTRGHMAALRLAMGAADFEKWLTALRDNGVRLYDGNARVVRAIADGEIDIGLTDGDDAAAAKRNHWPIDAVRDAVYPVSTPITVARVRAVKPPPGQSAIAAPPDAADRLIAFLRSPDVLKLLVDGETAAEPMPTGAGRWGATDWEAAAALVDEALATCERMLGR